MKITSFVCNKKISLLCLKPKYRRASNCCKRVLEAVKRAYANSTKESIISQKLGCRNFWRIANSILNKHKSVIIFLDSTKLEIVWEKITLFFKRQVSIIL